MGMGQPRERIGALWFLTRTGLLGIFWALLTTCSGCIRPAYTVETDGSTDSGTTGEDAATLTVVVEQYDYCDQVFFKLPPHYTDYYNGYFVFSPDYAVYSRKASQPHVYQMSIFDLVDCREYTLVMQGDQTAGMMRSRTLVWLDQRHYSPGTGVLWPNDVYMMDVSFLPAWPEMQVTDWMSWKFWPGFNDTYVIFADADDRMLIRGDLVLYNYHTGEKRVLAPVEAEAVCPCINDRYAAWVALSGDPPGTENAVFVLDLQLDQTFVVEPAPDATAICVSLSGDKIVWSEEHADYQYDVWLYDIPTQTATQIDEPGEEGTGGRIRRNLVSYDSDYQGNSWHITLYDIETGIRRRMTSHAELVSGHPEPPLLMLTRMPPLHSYGSHLYIFNMEMAGVLDSNGNLIPGDPAIPWPYPYE